MSIRNNLHATFLLAAASMAIPALAQDKMKSCDNLRPGVSALVSTKASDLFGTLQHSENGKIQLNGKNSVTLTHANSYDEVCVAVAGSKGLLTELKAERRYVPQYDDQPHRYQYTARKISDTLGKIFTLGMWHPN